MRQSAHAVRHGGGEQKRLAFIPTVRGDAHDVLVESHVQHAICLVQNQHLKGRQVDVAQCEVRQHASRRDNDDVRSLCQGLLFLGKLFACAAAINGERCDSRVISEALSCLVNLDGQLSCGHHDQGLDLSIVGGVHNAVHRGQQERRRLSGPRLRNAQNVLALNGMGNGLPLNGRGGFKSHGPKSVFNVWVQVEVLKPDSLFRRLGFACVLGVLFFHVSKVRRIPAPSRMFVIHPSSPTPTSVMNSTPTTLVFSKVVMGLLALVLGSPWAMATHLVGGDFSYVHLGGDNYEITLTVYRDCSPANSNGTYFDDMVAIGLWNGEGIIGPNDVLTIPLQTNNVSEVPVEMGNPCGTPPPDLCIDQAVYQTIVELPGNPYGWDLVYQRCCRNPTIVNLDDFGGAENAGMTLQIHIPGTDITTESNSSPAFQELPPVAMCTDLPFVWNHAALDPDGDELVYSLCAPKQGGDAANAVPNPPSTPPYVDVPYLAGFSWDNPMTADPVLAIDPVTGLLTCTPTAGRDNTPSASACMNTATVCFSARSPAISSST